MKSIKFNRSDSADVLIEPLRALLKDTIQDSDTAVIHSALTAFRIPTRGLKKVLVESIVQLADDGITVILPTFNFRFCEGVPFHYQRSKVETGFLPQLLLDSGQ